MLTTGPDLAFAPVTRTPAHLGAAQIAQYNREGHAGPFDVYGPAEAARVQAYVDRLMADAGEAGAYGINCYQARLAGLWDVATEPRILDLVEDIIGPDIVCWASAILSKAPGDPKRVPWHQDACFWALSPARTVTVWLAIDDADAENAAMRFIPRTHASGRLPEAATDGAAVFHKGTAGAEAMGEPFVNALRAGHCSLHADMLVHGSEPNLSERRRCGLTLRYCPPQVRITDPRWARGVEAIVARGTDPTGAWRHHPRPENDDIRATSSPHVLGNN